jgi:hypothetical protein
MGWQVLPINLPTDAASNRDSAERTAALAYLHDGHSLDSLSEATTGRPALLRTAGASSLRASLTAR